MLFAFHLAFCLENQAYKNTEPHHYCYRDQYQRERIQYNFDILVSGFKYTYQSFKSHRDGNHNHEPGQRTTSFTWRMQYIFLLHFFFEQIASHIQYSNRNDGEADRVKKIFVDFSFDYRERIQIMQCFKNKK